MRNFVLAYSNGIKFSFFVWRAGKKIDSDDLILGGLYLKVADIYKKRFEECIEKMKKEN